LANNGIFSSTRLAAEKRFVGYKSVLPSGAHTRVGLERDAVLAALQRVMLVSEMRNVGVKFSSGEVRFSSSDNKSGEAEDVVSAECGEDCPEMVINGKHLVEAFKNYASEKIFAEFRGPTRGLVLTDGEHINVIQAVIRHADVQ
jgi:DNA polymerase-3 subunit beta